MSKIILSILLVITTNVYAWGQITDGVFNITYGGTDTIIRNVKYKSDSFSIVYAYSQFNYMQTAVGMAHVDNAGNYKPFTEEEYRPYYHYFALVSVYKFGHLIFKDIGGYYVPNGCYEDTPEAYINEALKRQEDSAKVYWKKKVYWETRMNKELERLNKGGHANDISKALVRYQDSSIKYQLLLNKFKK